MTPPLFPYGHTETDHLCRRDKKLGAAIETIGPIARPLTPDLFSALMLSVVGQQISNKAAATVGRRLVERVGALTPERIAAASTDELQSCGLSFRKVAYLQGIAEAVRNGRFDIESLPGLPDDEVTKRLVALPGVGVWTAEMLMIFSMARPDVVSWGDLAIRRGMMRLYGKKELTKESFLRYRKRYHPYGSVASLYLWEIAKDD